MALYRYTLELPDGQREERMVAAGNGRAARQRADRHAAGHGGRVVGPLEVVDATRGSM